MKQQRSNITNFCFNKKEPHRAFQTPLSQFHEVTRNFKSENWKFSLILIISTRMIVSVATSDSLPPA